ncbi:hypothetical protein, partial [Streptomyces sp. Tu 6176]|uniref:hypothetical protein n=1 Tax=Streptomyces sp. Tu 6176 TaxID=1470557 RepID=UPI003B6409CB
MNDGFCQVGSRPPNPESATPPGFGPRARWIAGSPIQEGATAGRASGAAGALSSGGGADGAA